MTIVLFEHPEDVQQKKVLWGGTLVICSQTDWQSALDSLNNGEQVVIGWHGAGGTVDSGLVRQVALVEKWLVAPYGSADIDIKTWDDGAINNPSLLKILKQNNRRWSGGMMFEECVYPALQVWIAYQLGAVDNEQLAKQTKGLKNHRASRGSLWSLEVKEKSKYLTDLITSTHMREDHFATSILEAYKEFRASLGYENDSADGAPVKTE